MNESSQLSKKMLITASALMLLYAAPGPVLAEDPITPPDQSGVAPEVTPPPEKTQPPTDPMASFGDEPGETGAPANPNRYVAEVVDSLFQVGPAEFLALDLPSNPPGARAIHLLGTVNVTDKKGDIMVRLFRAPEYQNWLKKSGGVKANAYWTSKRSRSITLDQELPRDVPVVLLLDNGYSIRTPKKVRTQLQIQYQRTGATVSARTPGSSEGQEDDIITPRSNTEEDVPPPPPPPPSDGGQ